MSHNLNIVISSLMEAGNYTVSPQDSIEQVQRLLAIQAGDKFR